MKTKYKFKNKPSNRLYAWWYDRATNKKDLAGVAYYNDSTGHYTLKINFFPNNEYQIQCIGAENNISHFRLVSVKRNKRGKVTKRHHQGIGFLDEISGDIVMHASPFSKLILITSKKDRYEENSFKKSA